MAMAPSPERILFDVAIRHSVSVSDITGDRRTAEISAARDEACYLLKTKKGMTNPQVAELINRDPSTVSHSIKNHIKRTQEAEWAAKRARDEAAAASLDPFAPKSEPEDIDPFA